MSPTRIVLPGDIIDDDPSLRTIQPGPLKAVAIDTGVGLVHLNPEEGGVAVGVLKADIEIKDNESLYIYQSTKQLEVAGSGFDNVDVSMCSDAIGQRTTPRLDGIDIPVWLPVVHGRMKWYSRQKREAI